MRCSGTTFTGSRCRNAALGNGDPYCQHHSTRYVRCLANPCKRKAAKGSPFCEQHKAKTKMIYVDPAQVRANRETGTSKPVIVIVYAGVTTRCDNVKIDGPSEMVYESDRVWLKTRANVTVDGRLL